MMKRMIMFVVGILVSVSVSGFTLENAMLLNRPESPFQVAFSAEAGFAKVLAHTIQFGNSGTKFDYVNEGGQDILAPFSRYTTELTLAKRHSIMFLYQPLELFTSAILIRDVDVNSTTFSNTSAVNLKYGFSFWRLSYMYHFIENKNVELSGGLSLQLRNASISFESKDGQLFTVNQNLGPVPILKLRFLYRFNGGFWLGTEIDGFYASSSFFNGAGFDFEGSILDASLRFGLKLTEYLDTFVNIRYLGGSAAGTSQYTNSTPGVDGYTANYLDTMSFTLGFTIK